MLLAVTAQASFPVDKSEKAKTEVTENTDAAIEMEAINDVEFEEASLEQASADEDELFPRMSDEEMWITLALWFFLGAVAAHRWYRRKPVGWNILFILTAGGCGIWAIVDLVNILTKKF